MDRGGNKMKKISIETNSMKTLINGAEPIGRWIALIIHISSKVPNP
jgi:hypothetical protein